MVTNSLFRQCLAAIPQREKTQFEKSFAIAEHLAEILQEKHLSASALAKAIGTRKTIVDKWLTGRCNLRSSTITKIESALNCTLAN